MDNDPELREKSIFVCKGNSEIKFILPDSKHTCFFCLKYIVSPNLIKTEEGPDLPIQYDRSYQFPLRNMSRFLEFNGVESSISENRMVETCGNCFRLTEEFTEIYKALDMAKLRMNWCLRRICEVMRTAEKNELIENGNDGLCSSSRTGVFESLRRQTILNGQKRVRETTFPVVSVKRLRLPSRQVEEPTLMYDNNDFLSNASLSEDYNYSGQSEDKSLLSCSSNTDDDNLSEIPCQTQTKQGSPNPKPLFSPSGLPSRNHISCPFCRATFITKKTTETVQRLSLSIHIMRYHCETQFPGQKLETVTDFQYKKILSDLLFADLSKEGMDDFICVYCPKTFKTGTKRHRDDQISRFKLHLLNEHRNELEAKLVEIQRDPQLSEKLGICNPEGICCDCGVYLASNANLISHRRRHCTVYGGVKRSNEKKKRKLRIPGTDKRKITKANEIQPTTCPYCKMIIKNNIWGKKTFRHHLLRFHMEHFFDSVRIGELVTTEQFKRIVADLLFKEVAEKGDKDCRICRKKFGDLSGSSRFVSIQGHYIAKHYDLLKSKLDSIQEHPNLAEKLSASNPNGVMCSCGTYLKNAWNQTTHRNQCNCGPGPGSGSAIVMENRPKQENTFNRETSMSVNLVKRSRKFMRGNMIKSSGSDHLVKPKPNICPYCKMEGATKPDGSMGTGLRLHMMSYHTDHFFPNARNDNLVTREQFKRILGDLLFIDFVKHDDNKCRLCGKLFRSSNSLQRSSLLKDHLVGEHYETLKEKLDSIQEDPNLTQRLTTCNPNGVMCSSCGAYLRTPVSQHFHRKHSKCNVTVTIANSVDRSANKKMEESMKNTCTKPKTTATDCPYCKMSMGCVSNANKHLINYHMDHFFPKERNEMLVSSEQFKKIVADLLFSHFIEENDSDCKICKKKFTSSSFAQRSIYLKAHLLGEHFEDLKVKLTSIQNDPDLLELLSSCNPGAVICTCGAYLRNQKSRRNHEAFSQCKMEIAVTPMDSSIPSVDKSWNCEKCGQLYFSKELLNEHVRNDCAHSNSVTTGYRSDKAKENEMDGDSELNNGIDCFMQINAASDREPVSGIGASKALPT